MVNSADPVGAGLVSSLAQPGGNVTGMSGLGVELNTKRLEVLKDAIPKLTRVGIPRATTSPRRCFRRTPNERSQGCGGGTQIKIGGDNHQTGLESFRRCIPKPQAKAGGRDSCGRSPFIRGKKTTCRARRQVSVAGYLSSEGIKEYMNEGGLMYYGADFDDLFR